MILTSIGDIVSHPIIKKVLYAGSVIYISEVLYKYVKKYFDIYKKKNFDTLRDNLPHVIFFSNNSSSCTDHFNSATPCKEKFCSVNHLNIIVTYLESAQTTLDVCVYFLTIEQLVDAILNVYHRGVEVRVITDDEAKESGEVNQIQKMRKSGVKLRSRKSNYLMHHKFAIIDGEVLVTGSLNWTRQAFTGNCDNIIFHNNPLIVQSYLAEFNRMWDDLSVVKPMNDLENINVAAAAHPEQW